MTENLIKVLSDEKICPIIRSSKADEVISIANALKDGGINAVEIIMDNSEIYKAIEKISNDLTICAGGIITSSQAEAAISSGAKIISSPIFSMNLVKLSKDKEVPFIAGVSTVNEAYTAWKARIPLIKIYPITAMGGAKYVENILRPMSFLNLMPSGNIKLEEVKSYIKAGATVVGVGRDLYEGRKLAEITEKAKNILEELRNI